MLISIDWFLELTIDTGNEIMAERWSDTVFYLINAHAPIAHPVGGNRKRYQQLTNADQKSIETVFSIAICRQCGDKWQSKTLFLSIFDLRSSIVLAFSIAA